MENEIKVNEFVRTRYGEIAKVIECRDEIVLDKEIKFYGIYRGYICEDELDFIVKHSSNLIDLIQKDDFVNGDRVVAIDYTEDENGNYVDVLGIMEIDDDYAYPIELRVINIQEVVTKEMMESISYKVTKM